MSIFIGNCYAVIPVMMSRRSIKNAVVPDKNFLIPVILAMMIRRFLLQLIAGEGEGVHGRWVAFGFKSDLIWFILATRFLHKDSLGIQGRKKTLEEQMTVSRFSLPSAFVEVENGTVERVR